MKNFKAVVFDMDGVIFDSEKRVVECWKVIADKYGVPDIEAACRECFGCNQVVAKERFLKRYGEDFPYVEYKKEMSDLFHERYDNGNLPMLPGVVEILEFLKANGKRIALASSTRRVSVESGLTWAGIIDYFDAIICGDMVSRSKPEPDIFLKACEALGVSPSEAYAIEDSYNGIRAAHRGGLLPIMVPDMMEPDKEMEELSVAILGSLNEVIDYLKC
ncbi:MAG: HAD family phosphatase [Lachnospiraceae bacterium]|nr:HAD family phosphatase [Lachnospiraceae bacterium]